MNQKINLRGILLYYYIWIYIYEHANILLQKSRPALGLTQSPILWVMGFSPTGKAARALSCHSLPSRTEVKYEWGYTSIPSPHACTVWTRKALPLYPNFPNGSRKPQNLQCLSFPKPRIKLNRSTHVFHCISVQYDKHIFIITNTTHTIGVDKITLFKTT